MYPRRHFRRHDDRALRSKVRRLCRECHDALERLIQKWERSVYRLWETELAFYEWIVEAFIEVEDAAMIEPGGLPLTPHPPWDGFAERAAL